MRLLSLLKLLRSARRDKVRPYTIQGRITMPLTRRQFLIGAAATGTAAAAAGCAPDWMNGLDEKPTAIPRDNMSYSTGPVTWTPTPPANIKPPSDVAFGLTRMTFGPRPG